MKTFLGLTKRLPTKHVLPTSKRWLSVVLQGCIFHICTPNLWLNDIESTTEMPGYRFPDLWHWRQSVYGTPAYVNLYFYCISHFYFLFRLNSKQQQSIKRKYTEFLSENITIILDNVNVSSDRLSKLHRNLHILVASCVVSYQAYKL